MGEWASSYTQQWASSYTQQCRRSSTENNNRDQNNNMCVFVGIIGGVGISLNECRLEISCCVMEMEIVLGLLSNCL